MRSTSANTKTIGRQAELAACRHLEQQGLSLLCQNYRCLFGEIDLIMKEGKTIVFIEVRHRRSAQYGSALDSITPSKVKKIIKTAQHFLQSKHWLDKVGCRFDIMTSELNNGKSTLAWYKNAYTADAW